MKNAILLVLIVSFSIAALAKKPEISVQQRREDFYNRILFSRMHWASAATYSGYKPTPQDKFFYFAFVESETRANASVHSNFVATEARYAFLESLWRDGDWVQAATSSDYTPTKREKFFLLLRQGDGLQSAMDNSGHIPTRADRFYYEVYIAGRSPYHASEETGFVPGRRKTASFECAISFGLTPP